MGMPVSVLVRGPAARSTAVDKRVARVYDELRAVDAGFSPYRPDSAVSRLARGERVTETEELAQVRDLCEQARRSTGGAFDATRPDGTWDPSGLVKTWAVERAARHLGGLAFCLNAGGDVHVESPRGEPFRVGVQDPRDGTRVLTALDVVQGGVATSGTAARGAHVYDPLTGQPAAGALSVTVTGPSLLAADVLATAALVRGLQVLPAGTPALLVHPDGSRTQTLAWRGSPVRPSRTLDHGSRQGA